MYESYFELREKPFSLLPDPGFIYLSPSHEEALTILEYGLLNQAGFIVLTGEIGVGKTTVMRSLLDRLDEGFTIGLISHTHQSLGDLMQWVCSSFDIDTRALGKVDLHQVFVDFVIGEYARGKRTLLIVDEAQNLGSENLEQLRLLSNINSNKDLVLQLMLLGQPQLRELLRQPGLQQFVQRVSASYHLSALSETDTEGYIRHRIAVAGAPGDLFAPDACDAVYGYSKGVPRLINLICDSALVYAYAAQRPAVTADIVDEFVETQADHLLIPLERSVEPRRRRSEQATAASPGLGADDREVRSDNPGSSSTQTQAQTVSAMPAQNPAPTKSFGDAFGAKGGSDGDADAGSAASGTSDTLPENSDVATSVTDAAVIGPRQNAHAADDGDSNRSIEGIGTGTQRPTSNPVHAPRKDKLKTQADPNIVALTRHVADLGNAGTSFLPFDDFGRIPAIEHAAGRKRDSVFQRRALVVGGLALLALVAGLLWQGRPGLLASLRALFEQSMPIGAVEPSDNESDQALPPRGGNRRDQSTANDREQLATPDPLDPVARDDVRAVGPRAPSRPGVVDRPPKSGDESVQSTQAESLPEGPADNLSDGESPFESRSAAPQSVDAAATAEPEALLEATGVSSGAATPPDAESTSSIAGLASPSAFAPDKDRPEPSGKESSEIAASSVARSEQREVDDAATGAPLNSAESAVTEEKPPDVRDASEMPMEELEADLRASMLSVERASPNRLVADLGDKVQFEAGSVTLDSHALTFLELLVGEIRQSLPLQVRVVGHTDHRGRADVNERLSERRAEAVAQFLAGNGIPSADLSFGGKGESEPKVELAEEWRLGPSVNRRIELEFVKPSIGDAGPFQ
ncbi:MAG: AAA family ATPase [Thiohalocapsa sp.]